MRIVMMGTGPFAVPTFEKLLASEHQIAALVTRPPHGRRPAPPNPMREVASAAGMSIFDPENINAPESLEMLRGLAADLFVVCDYGQILSRDALAASRLGGINLHASLLPKYRGAAPINWAIYHGETETGVTVIHMTPALDGGPCLVQVATPLDPDETAPQVEARLAKIGVDAVIESIGILEKHGLNAPGKIQDASLATRAPRLKKTQGLVDWKRSAREIHNQVRAFQPWPKTYTFCTLPNTGTQRLILDETAVEEETRTLDVTAGTVIEAGGECLIAACGLGTLLLKRVQLAGKRSMNADEFLHGNALHLGAVLTSIDPQAP